ncbi:MAG: hypothetical protein EOO32_04495 [Comamonadaceae bacterium]|nr:MAG: hypothetical protein EOO32_04495 [Comamonadaceae bacterium]
MIDSNSLSAQVKQRAIMAQLAECPRAHAQGLFPHCNNAPPTATLPTDPVDNFVGNRVGTVRKTAPNHGFDRLMKNRAVKNHLKSTTCTYLRALEGLCAGSALAAATPPLLWTTAMAQRPSSPQTAYV